MNNTDLKSVENGKEPSRPMMDLDGEQFTGLTKREEIAKCLMAAIYANPSHSWEGAAEQAVYGADELLAELAK